MRRGRMKAMAKIIDVGIAQGDMNYIIQRGVILLSEPELPIQNLKS